MQDVKALSSIARKAAHPGTALDAAQRIADRAELLNVAVKTDHKDAGVAALERAVESNEAGELRETLDLVAARAKNKSVSKRARAMMQALDEAQAARRVALEAWQQQVAGLVARVESISPAAEGAAQELERTEGEWAALATEPAFELEPDSVARFEGAAGRARSGIAEHQRMEAERRAEDDRRAALHASRAAMIQQVESIRGEDALERIEQATREWEALGAAEDDAAMGALGTQFESAVAAARQRHQNQLDMQQTHARLAELASEAERLSGEESLAREAWTAATAEWTALVARSEGLDEAVSQRYEQAVARVAQRAEEQHAAEERTQRQQLQRVEQLIERAQKRSAAEDLTLREAERLSRDLRSAADAPPPVDKEQQAALLERLKAAAAVITPRVHDLREMDEWKRFANAAVQEELIARAEALRARFGFDAPEGPKEEDLDKAARELHDIQERWKSVAEAPRAQAQALWHRYRQAADPIQARLREFFSHRNEERKGNLDKKLALIARAEELADSTDWIKTADELKKLQAEWQQIGPVPRQETRATWKQFREACDRFFTRRNADLAERKETWTANLTRKEALCARAEELASSREWDKAAAEIRRLQADWKTIGPVRRNKSEAVWQRFRTACDTFFDRYKRRDEIELESKQADREQLVAELEALSPAEGAHQRHRCVGAARTGPVAAQPLERLDAGRAARRGSAQRAFRRRARARADDPSGRVQGHGARRRTEPPEDGKAGDARRRLHERGRAGARQFVAGARRHAARGARLEHHRRPRRRGEQVADDGRGRPAGAGGMEPARPGSWRHRPGAQRAVPPRRHQVLRSVPPQGAAAAADLAAGAQARGDALVRRTAAPQELTGGPGGQESFQKIS